MQKIRHGDTAFSVDVEKTGAYYAAQAPCDCADCRNLYPQIESVSPVLTAFLQSFGIDLRRPDEVGSIEMEGYIDYLFVVYTVTGTMSPKVKVKTNIDGLNVTLASGEITEEWFPNEQQGDYFLVTVEGLRLPWVLDELFPQPKPGAIRRSFNWCKGLVQKLRG